jgi:hypothetical protein
VPSTTSPWREIVKMSEPFSDFLELCQKYEYKIDLGMSIDIAAYMEGDEAVVDYEIRPDLEKSFYKIDEGVS